MSLLSAIIDTLHFKRKDGSEYIVYPATKEKAVTDENGQRLDRKLEKIQNDINNVVAGELPDGTTYVDLDNPGAEEVPDDILLDADTLQGHGADYFAVKTDIPESTEPWDYVLKYPDKIMLQNSAGEAVGEIAPGKTGGYTLNAADGTTVVNVDAAKVASLMQGFNLFGTGNIANGLKVLAGGILELLTQFNVKNDKSITFLDSSGNSIARIYAATDGVLHFQYKASGNFYDYMWMNANGTYIRNLIIDRSMNYNNNVAIEFGSAGNAAPLHRILESTANNFVLQSRASGSDTWKNVLYIQPDGSIMISRPTVLNASPTMVYGAPALFANDTSARFADKENKYYNFEWYSSPKDEMVLRYKTTATSLWQYCIHVDNTGTVHFNKAIDAPNIASTTAELLSIQQDLTEKDIESIKTQQKITTMELAMIESGVLQS